MFKVRLLSDNFAKCTKSLRMCEEVQMIRGQIASNVNRDDLNYLDKIVFLQKCVLKMEKLYRKSEKEHDRRITELKQEIELMRKSEQVRFVDIRATNILNTNVSINSHSKYCIRQLRLKVLVFQLFHLNTFSFYEFRFVGTT